VRATRPNASWVYVTGAPRSGTTAFGTRLAAPDDTTYIHEPFNPLCGTPELGPSDPLPPVGAEELATLDAAVRRLQQLRLETRRERFQHDTTLTYARRRVLGGRTDHSLRLARWTPKRPLVVVKDPVGVFLTRSLVERAGWRAVAIVRDPLGVVASMHRLGWSSAEPARANVESLRRVGMHPDVVDRLDRLLAEVRDGGGVVAHAVRWCAVNLWLRDLADQRVVTLVSYDTFRERPVDEINRVRQLVGFGPVTPEALDRLLERRRLARRVLGPFGSAIGQLDDRVRVPARPLTAGQKRRVLETAEPLAEWLDSIGVPWTSPT
jgi:hypothetical protein